MATCFVPMCGGSPMRGDTLYRVNKPGEMPAVWACQKHISRTDSAPDEEVVDIVRDVGGKVPRP